MAAKKKLPLDDQTLIARARGHVRVYLDTFGLSGWDVFHIGLDDLRGSSNPHLGQVAWYLDKRVCRMWFDRESAQDPALLEYLCAHEVAHMLFAEQDQLFQRAVAELTPALHNLIHSQYNDGIENLVHRLALAVGAPKPYGGVFMEPGTTCAAEERSDYD